MDGDGQAEVVTGGAYYDGSGYVAQLFVWNGYDLALEDVAAWCWADSTFLVSVAVGDADSDGGLEILTGGGYYDGARYCAQLSVWATG